MLSVGKTIARQSSLRTGASRQDEWRLADAIDAAISAGIKTSVDAERARCQRIMFGVLSDI